MLPKRRRLSAAEVREVIAQGRGRRGEVLSSKNVAKQGPFACAVVVSKKVAKSAVRRNSLRRAVYRALQGATLPQSGHMVLFYTVHPPSECHGRLRRGPKKAITCLKHCS